MNYYNKISRKIFLPAFVLLIAVSSVVFGMFLILSREKEAEVRYLMEAGSVYLIQARQNDPETQQGQELLERARQMMAEALEIFPFDALLWVRFSYVIALMNQEEEQAVTRALDIAASLRPNLQNEINRHRQIIRESMQGKRQ